LGRLVDDSGIATSLGPFFSDRNVSNEEALSVDRMVRRYAMQKYAEEKRTEFLFINYRLAWLSRNADRPEAAYLVVWAQEYGIAPEKIVIEITEEDFNSDSAYMQVLTYYKNMGFRIALDDYGKSASNIERLAELRPDIIKINLGYIHNSESSYHYREYLRALASFADAVGIEVLYEGVETLRQLEICMEITGRYYQGYFLAPPQASMCGAVVNRDVFTASASGVRTALQAKIAAWDICRRSFDARIEIFLAAHPFDGRTFDMNEYLTRLCRELSDARRIYLCDGQGVQITHNIERRDGELVSCDYRKKDWSWRGYFSKALETLALGGKSGISNNYRDFTTKCPILTYFYAIGSDMLLFVDVEASVFESPDACSFTPSARVAG
jgi:EAL domain-containing protein (putative c-di-GMP-specific phosphodiesterase class I)